MTGIETAAAIGATTAVSAEAAASAAAATAAASAGAGGIAGGVTGLFGAGPAIGAATGLTAADLVAPLPLSMMAPGALGTSIPLATDGAFLGSSNLAAGMLGAGPSAGLPALAPGAMASGTGPASMMAQLQGLGVNAADALGGRTPMQAMMGVQGLKMMGEPPPQMGGGRRPPMGAVPPAGSIVPGGQGGMMPSLGAPPPMMEGAGGMPGMNAMAARMRPFMRG